VNFIVIYLCDNDFANSLEAAARIVFSEYGSDQAKDVFQRGIIAVTAALADLRHPEYSQKHPSLPYLKESLSVEYAKEPPTKDHDGGSVCIDVHQNYIWRF